MTFNVSLLRNWRISERGRLQFRWEVFNAFNHANFGLPNADVNLLTAGLRYQF